MSPPTMAYPKARRYVIHFYNVFDKTKLHVAIKVGLELHPDNLFCEIEEYSDKKSEWFPKNSGMKARKRIPDNIGDALVTILTSTLTPKPSYVNKSAVRCIALNDKEIRRINRAWVKYKSCWSAADSRRVKNRKSTFVETSVETKAAIEHTERCLKAHAFEKQSLSDRNGIKNILDKLIYDERRIGNYEGAIRTARNIIRVVDYAPSALGLTGHMIPILKINLWVRIGWIAMQSHNKNWEDMAVREMTKIDALFSNEIQEIGNEARLRVMLHEGYNNIKSNNPYILLGINQGPNRGGLFGYDHDAVGYSCSLLNAAQHAAKQQLPYNERLNVLNNMTVMSALDLAWSMAKDRFVEPAAFTARTKGLLLAKSGDYHSALQAIELGENLIKKSGKEFVAARISLVTARAKVLYLEAERNKSVAGALEAGINFEKAARMADYFNMHLVGREIRGIAQGASAMQH